MVSMSVAPGGLEQVRAFLNTWRLPHETRTPADDLPELAADKRAWRAQFPEVPPPAPGEVPELTELRTALRESLGQSAPAGLNTWFERHPIRVTVGEESPIRYVAEDGGAVSALLVLVTGALAHEVWARLKSCPDCRNVFYDHSRNRSRTWCAMYAETPDGRACGSIAKVRAYRSRKRDS